MKPFTTLQSTAAPLFRTNIDTDTIIPSREIKSSLRSGLGPSAFAGWRYLGTSREPNPDFVFNQPRYAGASILLADENFGCGSSREAAVWALEEFGLRCIIAPSFGAIFKANCLANGLLPVVLDREVVAGLTERAATSELALEVDLARLRVTDAQRGDHWSFEIAERAQRMLLGGLDEIGVTLLMQDQIAQFQQRDRRQRPWIWL